MNGIDALARRIERFGAAEVKQRVATAARDAAHAECVTGFVQQRDPYGTRWAPRWDRSEPWPLLDKTGKGVEGLTSRALLTGVVMRIVGYFKFHQSGTKRMTARMIFPEPARGLGLWSEPVRAAVTKEISR